MVNAGWQRGRIVIRRSGLPACSRHPLTDKPNKPAAKAAPSQPDNAKKTLFSNASNWLDIL
jgi:hypothetical protein